VILDLLPITVQCLQWRPYPFCLLLLSLSVCRNIWWKELPPQELRVKTDNQAGKPLSGFPAFLMVINYHWISVEVFSRLSACPMIGNIL